MPKQTTGRNLSIRLAVVFLCCFAPFGCAQGLRPTLPKLWGPDRITVKDAAGGLSRIVRRKGKEAAQANSREPLVASKKSSANARFPLGGVDVTKSTPPADEQKSSVLAGLAAIVDKRADRERAVVDPFTAAYETARDKPEQRAEPATPQQNSTPQYAAAANNPFAGMIGVAADTQPPASPRVDKNPFVEEFDSQLERLRASVEDELVDVESPATQTARVAEARDHIRDLMQQAEQAIAQGRLSDAATTLESASELTSRMGVFFGPDEKQPGDLLRNVRDRIQEQQAAIAAEQRLDESIAREADQRPATPASNPFLPSTAVTEAVNEPAGETQAVSPFEVHDEPSFEAREEQPQEQLVDNPAPLDESHGSIADTHQPTVDSYSGVRIYPRDTRPQEPNESMIIDAANVPSRFRSRRQVPAEWIVPAGSTPGANARRAAAPPPWGPLETGNDSRQRPATEERQTARGNQAGIGARSKSSVPTIDQATLGRLKQSDLLNFQPNTER